VTRLNLAGTAGSLSHIDATQADFRSQVAALNDIVRQLAGNANVASGSAEIVDPLTAPFTLYVNPYIGSDTFASGSYNSTELTGAEPDAEKISAKLKRLDNQRLTCGYTPSRPFKTINRAVIEAAIITSKNWYSFTSPEAHLDCVSIVLSAGVHTVYNDPGDSNTAALASWSSQSGTYEPSIQELVKFNPPEGGVLLPRGCSLCGPDLRKVTIRPNWVKAAEDETANYSNHRQILKITGTGYFFGFTVMDKINLTTSHHLMSVFGFASKTELDLFYQKVYKALGENGNPANLGQSLVVTRGTEYNIVAPVDLTQTPTSDWDATASASPYIFNVSIRSEYGLGGAWIDGAKVGGFKSMVCANFTGVSLQKDMNSWQIYANGGWSTANYTDYINADPDNVRMNPARLSRHIVAINDAFIQAVSVFAIGQGVHHFTSNGGEITITNSNSSFGGCAAISSGYRGSSFGSDTNWQAYRIKVATNLAELEGNVKRIYLGTISAITSTTLTLESALGESETITGVPDIVARDGYTLRSASYVWVENPLGDDWRSTFTSSAWSTSAPTVLNISGQITTESGAVPGVLPGSGVNNAVGKRVYIRRFVDTRSPAQRRYTLQLTADNLVNRTPFRDYALQTDAGSYGYVSGLASDETLLVTNAGKLAVTGKPRAAEVSLRRGNPENTWQANTFYRKGSVVRLFNKHYIANLDHQSAQFDAALWDEAFVHMSTEFNAEDSIKAEAPIITFDDDQSGSENYTSSQSPKIVLGYNLSTVWTTNQLIQTQYRSAADYQGLHQLLTGLGFSSNQAHDILLPRSAADRELNPSVAADMKNYTPNGAVNVLTNWGLEFRRPSVIRMYGHAWEWAGYLNYSKSLPSIQKDLSVQNKFSYYFTSADGGRVYGTGFNEEGYQVTPRGIEDPATGSTLSVENLGASDIGLEQPTELNNIQLKGTTDIADTLNITASNVSWSVASQGAVTRYGVGKIATVSELTDPANITTDTQLDAAGARFVTPEGLHYYASNRYAAALNAASRRVYVFPTGATLPANASAYPLITGGTVNLNDVTLHPSIQAAYNSLPDNFTIDPGDHIDIYLLSDNVDMGAVADGTIGSSDPSVLTYIVPNQWDDPDRVQVIDYSQTDSFNQGNGPFRNVVFYTTHPDSAPIPQKGRFHLRSTLAPLNGGDARTTCVVGENIQTSNLLVEVILNSSDVNIYRTIKVFIGAHISPFVPYLRHNNKPVYFGLKLSGDGHQVKSGGQLVPSYDVTVFHATENHPVEYGAAMVPNDALPAADEDKRKATAYFEFINNRSTADNPPPTRILFNLIDANAEFTIDGASYGGYTSNLSWILSGTKPWEWRLWAFRGLFDSLDGRTAANSRATLTQRGLSAASWGGLFNNNSSTNWFKSVHSPGPYTNFFVESGYGVFGAHNSVTAADSLLGADDNGTYYLQPSIQNFSIVGDSTDYETGVANGFRLRLTDPADSTNYIEINNPNATNTQGNYTTIGDETSFRFRLQCGLNPILDSTYDTWLFQLILPTASSLTGTDAPQTQRILPIGIGSINDNHIIYNIMGTNIAVYAGISTWAELNAVLGVAASHVFTASVSYLNA